MELNPKILARIEHQFSQLRCGLSGPEGMLSELDALEISDPLPYLVEMAHKEYPPRLAGLNSVGVALIGVRPDPRAQATLRSLYHDRSISLPARLRAATWLASRFQDDSGLPLMAPRLRSKDVQTRADTLTYMSDILNGGNVELILPLAKDRDIYVLERFGHMSNYKSEFRRIVTPQLTRELQTSRGEDAARIGFVLMLMGDPSGDPAVRDYLLRYTSPNDSESLRQLAYWCHDLARKGQSLGLDASVHLFELYLVTGHDGWLGFAINNFAAVTEFPHRATQSEADNMQTAREAIAWWKTNKDLVRFNPSSGRFTRPVTAH